MATNVRSTTRRESINQALIGKSNEKQKNKDKEVDKTPKHENKQGNKQGASPINQIKEASKRASKETSGDSSLSAEFECFKQDIKLFFIQYDEKLDKKLQQFDTKFTAVFDDLRKDMNLMRSEVYDTKNEVADLNRKVKDLEEALEFQTRFAEDRDDARGDLINKHYFELKQLQRKITLQEKHDRKYNLLFYGFQEERKEDLETTMKVFFKEKLEIDEEEVDKIVFANYHRIPTKAEGPKPIIVKFLTMHDRDLVYAKFLHPVLRKERKRILTDLPLEMKQERGKLAEVAYNIRQKEKLQTRIVEKGLQLYIEVREDKDKPWKRRYRRHEEDSDNESV